MDVEFNLVMSFSRCYQTVTPEITIRQYKIIASQANRCDNPVLRIIVAGIVPKGVKLDWSGHDQIIIASKMIKVLLSISAYGTIGKQGDSDLIKKMNEFVRLFP